MRGIFSNLYAEDAKDYHELMEARGDSLPNSAMAYISDRDSLREEFEKAIVDSRYEIFKKQPIPMTSYKPRQIIEEHQDEERP